MDRGKDLWQQSVAAHRHPQTRLAQLEYKEHRGDRDDRGDGYDARDPGDVHALRAKNESQGIADVKLCVVHHSGQHQRQDHVKDRTDEQAVDHPARQRLVWVLAFLCGRRQGVKSDICEEYGGYTSHHAFETVRQERMPVSRVYIECTENDHQQDDRQLYGDHNIRRFLRFANTDVYESGDENDDAECRKIGDQRPAANMRCGRPCGVCVHRAAANYSVFGAACRLQRLNGRAARDGISDCRIAALRR